MSGSYGEQPERFKELMEHRESQANNKQVTAAEFLVNAERIMAERGRQYDKPSGERSMGKCVDAFNIITGRNLSEAEGWLMLQVLKDVRLFQNKGFHQDSAEDCIAYAALKAEAKQHESTNKEGN